jgi:hypothetical protein
MKARIAQAGEEAASPPGCALIFFWGLETVKFISRAESGIRRVCGVRILYSALA